ncbi:MAG: DMT family transporter [Rhodospirillaceae bacterium]
MPSAPLCFIASAFLLALGSVLAKLLLTLSLDGSAGIAPLPFLSLQLLGGVGFLLIVKACRSSTRPHPPPWRLLQRPALAGVILGIGSLGTILALALISASEASVVFATQPMVILGLAALLLGERISPTVILLCAIAIGGILLIIGSGGLEGSPHRAAGLGCAGLSTLCAALYVVWMRGHSIALDPSTSLLVVLGTAMAVSIAASGASTLMGLSYGGLGSPAVQAAAIATGALYYGAAFLIYLQGLKTTEAAKAGIYLCLVPVFVIALAWGLLGERLSPLQGLGAVLVIAAVGGVSWLSVRPPHSNSTSS